MRSLPTTLQDRDVVATRPLRRSAVDSHDPVSEIDWDAPLDPALPAVPLHRVSLYGTRSGVGPAERVRALGNAPWGAAVTVQTSAALRSGPMR